MRGFQLADEQTAGGANSVRRVVRYWRQGLATQNFGDYLSEVLLSGLACGGVSTPAEEPADLPFSALYLIGSVITDWHIEQGISHATKGRVGFWGCGLRQAAPPAFEALRHCQFMGVRGPLTREALRLPEDTPIGDPALLLPALYSPPFFPSAGGPSLCIPHFHDQRTAVELRAVTGADLIVRPEIPTGLDFALEMIDMIAAASFVLCGALHAAVIAAAYEVPFAYFESGRIDVPFKWADFSASIGIEARFFDSVEAGYRFYDAEWRHAIRIPELDGLLDCCPVVSNRALM